MLVTNGRDALRYLEERWGVPWPLLEPVWDWLAMPAADAEAARRWYEAAGGEHGNED